MRLLPALLLGSLLLLSSCAGPRYEKVMAGAGVGAAIGGASGALCCNDPVNNTGPGILIGAGIGALVAAIMDM